MIDIKLEQCTCCERYIPSEDTETCLGCEKVFCLNCFCKYHDEWDCKDRIKAREDLDAERDACYRQETKIRKEYN